MEQIKRPRQSLSLKKILALYVLVSILVALFLSVATFSICNTTVEGIRASYHICGNVMSDYFPQFSIAASRCLYQLSILIS